MERRDNKTHKVSEEDYTVRCCGFSSPFPFGLCVVLTSMCWSSLGFTQSPDYLDVQTIYRLSPLPPALGAPSCVLIRQFVPQKMVRRIPYSLRVEAYVLTQKIRLPTKNRYTSYISRHKPQIPIIWQRQKWTRTFRVLIFETRAGSGAQVRHFSVKKFAA